MRYFEWSHLPAHLQAISQPFHVLALELAVNDALDHAERNMALRKLLEAKDCAVRSAL